MTKYALLRDGVFQNVVKADADWQPPAGYTKEVFDASVHIVQVPETERWVDFNRFMFELHTLEQRLAADAAKAEADALSASDIIGLPVDPTSLSPNGYPVYYLVVIRQAYQQKEALRNRVDLLSDDMQTAFDAFTACGVYGADPAAIASEIARIKSNTEPV